MGLIRSTLRRGATRRRWAVLGVLSLLALSAQLVLAASAGAVAFTGGFSPRIVSGLADLNGNRIVNGRDDANAFYGDTHIIDGRLDCDAWGAFANAGTPGDELITNADDCSLVGFDGTAGGVVIDIVNGVFQVGNGPLPTVFNAADPSNPDIGDSDFAWSARDGRVDSNGDEMITWEDCHFGLIGRTVDDGLGDATDGADILGNDGTNPCGFNPPPNTARNGFVDLNSDGAITLGADSCANSCFFGHDVRAGRVQAECPGFAGDPRNDVTGTVGPDVLVGTTRGDIICGFGGGDLLIGRGGRDVLLGGAGGDTLRGGPGADRLFGQRGNDRLFGGLANDFLNCGPGFDRGVGGPGRDTIVGCESRQQ